MGGHGSKALTSVAPEPPAPPLVNSGAEGIMESRVQAKSRRHVVRHGATCSDNRAGASRTQGAGVGAQELNPVRGMLGSTAIQTFEEESLCIPVAHSGAQLNIGWGSAHSTNGKEREEKAQDIDALANMVEHELDGRNSAHRSAEDMLGETSAIRRKLDFSHTEIEEDCNVQETEKMGRALRARAETRCRPPQGSHRISLRHSETEKKLMQMLQGELWDDTDASTSEGDDSDPQDLDGLDEFESSLSRRLGECRSEDQQTGFKIREEALLPCDSGHVPPLMQKSEAQQVRSNSTDLVEELKREISESRERTLDHLEMSRAPTRPSSSWRRR